MQQWLTLLRRRFAVRHIVGQLLNDSAKVMPKRCTSSIERVDLRFTVCGRLFRVHAAQTASCESEAKAPTMHNRPEKAVLVFRLFRFNFENRFHPKALGGIVVLSGGHDDGARGERALIRAIDA